MAEGTEPTEATMQDRLNTLCGRLSAVQVQLSRISPHEEASVDKKRAETPCCEFALGECEDEANELLARVTYIADHIGAL